MRWRSVAVPGTHEMVPLAALPQVFPRAMVRRAIDAEGAGESRRRSLPAPLVVYLNLALGAHPALGYTEVLDLLLAALPSRTRAGWRRASSTSIAAARRRLGPEVMRRLFLEVAGDPAHLAGDPAHLAGEPARPAGQALVALQMTLAVPESPDNRAAFGGPSPTSRPRVRLGGLVCPATGSVHTAAWSPYREMPRLPGAESSLPTVHLEPGARSRYADGVIAEIWSLLCLHQAAVLLRR